MWTCRVHGEKMTANSPKEEQTEFRNEDELSTLSSELPSPRGWLKAGSV